MKSTKCTVACLLLVSTLLFISVIPSQETPSTLEDLDPLIDIVITVTIKEIRAFDTIDLFSDPDFYVKVFIDDQEFTSPTWYNTQYIVDPGWAATYNVPDDQESINIKIQLWDKNPFVDVLCDISGDYQTTSDQYDAEIRYNIGTAEWRGDDWFSSESTRFDPSGYGRLNGCDDNSIYDEDRDCELLFDITQNDYDNDGIPYWTEMNLYGTDPEVNDAESDVDSDGIPLWWEHRWGYNPFSWDNHSVLDPDEDGLQNNEEYWTAQWGSDPFRQDIFLEIDQMEIGPNGEGNLIPEGSKDLLRDAYGKHNIVFHIDDGCMGGGELYPFDMNVSFDEIGEIYWKYFMHENPDNWRRGAFHYAVVTYHSDYYHGFAFGSYVDENHPVLLDCFHLATKEHEVVPFKYPFMRLLGRKSFNKEYNREIIYASAMMHETGHVLGIFYGNMPGCDNQTGKFPWQKNWWFWRNYRSVMNYGWMYTFVDYSDGSHGKNDFDDWGFIDLTRFQREASWH